MTKTSMATKREIVEKHHAKYLKSSKEEKGAILMQSVKRRNIITVSMIAKSMDVCQKGLDADFFNDIFKSLSKNELS